jgi:hypothetical protein
MNRLILFLLLLSACTDQNEQKTKMIDFGTFSIELPESWQIREVKGIDSEVKEIITQEGDTLHFDYGLYSNPLNEEEERIYPEKLKAWFITNHVDTTGKIFLAKDSITEQDREKYRKQQISYQIIDGYQAKIVSPKHPGIGLTGVYFDSLSTIGEGMGNIKLEFSGENIQPKNNALFQQAIRTIQFKK